ncbi:MAG: hypothetical protein WC869_11770 [Phycisphaerae bacterium]|jgi:hypothetical protein
MPDKLTEAQARRICEALDIDPNEVRFTVSELMHLAGPAITLLKAATAGDGRAFVADQTMGQPAWRIVQRAAAEKPQKEPTK